MLLLPLKILWFQASVFRDSGQHLRPNFFAVMESPDVIRVTGAHKFEVRANLTRFSPTDPLQGLQDKFRACTGPAAQAQANSTLDFRDSRSFSSFSARAR